ncbi:MAG: zinc dependent phospholipase C family protein [Anaerolineae bacterium]|nr:zinc dependent phospholipase C family protein [Anaerolineae bacterium]
MPTPVTHLVIAHNILNARPELIPDNDASARAAFLLGSTLADVRVLTGAPRAATHFLGLPPSRGDSGIRALLRAYPQLANLDGAGRCTRLMVAGYLAHLLADEIWLMRIFWPHFRRRNGCDETECLLRHDLLRSEMDQRDRLAAPRDSRRVLESARCASPFPFISDGDVEAWRQLLVRELESPDSSPTFAHFASRHRLPLADFVALLRSPEYMERVRRMVPDGALERFHSEAAGRGGALVAAYLVGRVREFPLLSLDPDNLQPYV